MAATAAIVAAAAANETVAAPLAYRVTRYPSTDFRE